MDANAIKRIDKEARENARQTMTSERMTHIIQRAQAQGKSQHKADMFRRLASDIRQWTNDLELRGEDEQAFRDFADTVSRMYNREYQVAREAEYEIQSASYYMEKVESGEEI